MRKLAVSILLLALLVSIVGCAEQDENIRFYYLRSEYIPGTSDGVIAAEARAVAGDRSLNYILRLYLEGPVSELYTSPFPSGVYLLNTLQEGDTLEVILSTEFAALEDIDLTLAAGCLATTCFALTDAKQVHIISNTPDGNLTITLDRDSLVLLDRSAATEPAE